MDASAACEQLKSICQTISLETMKMHPLAGKLPAGTARDEVYKALFELTKQVEIVKKQCLKVQKEQQTGETSDTPLL
jgi:hypothetical protein